MTCNNYFVDVTALKERWPAFPAGDEPTAEVLLTDAVTIIKAHTNGNTLDADAVTMVACQMVKRAMQASTAPDGVDAMTQTVGPFSQNMSFANPHADLYLTKAEKRFLGVGAQRASSVDMLTGKWDYP